MASAQHFWSYAINCCMFSIHLFLSHITQIKSVLFAKHIDLSDLFCSDTIAIQRCLFYYEVLVYCCLYVCCFRFCHDYLGFLSICELWLSIWCLLKKNLLTVTCYHYKTKVSLRSKYFRIKAFIKRLACRIKV